VNSLQRNPVLLGCHYCTAATPRTNSKDRFTRWFRADLCPLGAPQRLVRRFVSWAGGIDVLVQLCGTVSNPTPWHTIKESEWDSDLRLNLSVPFFLARSAMTYMQHSGGGRIVLTGTASARHGGGRTSVAYGAAKAGIECITKGLAREGASHRILVNAVLPGFIRTEFHTRTMGRSKQDLRCRAKLVTLKRPGSPTEVANLIVFLISPEASYITGEAIAVSGGDWL
jgi:NAD(P)-dependent dehydrogenase (short-subunit alcohol dehydrogenase family)